MDIGVVVPQGWTGEYDGWDTPRAWERTVSVARPAERLGFESVWVIGHFPPEPDPTAELPFESFTPWAGKTRLLLRGHRCLTLLTLPGRWPGLTAKMIG